MHKLVEPLAAARALLWLPGKAALGKRPEHSVLGRHGSRSLPKQRTKEDTMRRTSKALATFALGLALATATTAAATSPTGTQDQTGQRKALYQSELQRNLQQRTQAGDEVAVGQRLTGKHRALYLAELARNRRQRTQADNQVAVGHGLVTQRQALYGSELERTLARHRALGAIAAQPAAKTDPAAPNPGVNVPATLLVGLVGGLLGGAAVMVGWTATIRRRRPQTAAGT
jgi:hypothetical protein